MVVSLKGSSYEGLPFALVEKSTNMFGIKKRTAQNPGLKTKRVDIDYFLRPERNQGESFYDYKLRRKQVKEYVRNRTHKGKMVWVSASIFDKNAGTDKPADWRKKIVQGQFAREGKRISKKPIDYLSYIKSRNINLAQLKAKERLKQSKTQ